MSTLALDIPDDVRLALKLPPEEAERELRKELALALYQRRVLPIGKARALARMTRWEFEDLLGQRRAVRHYSAEDLREDIAHAGDRQQAGSSARGGRVLDWRRVVR